MKKNILVFVALVIISFQGMAQDKAVLQKDLPKSITTYTQSHFPNQKIIQSEKDMDGLSFTYELVLDNATKLEFSNKGAIIEVKSKSKLPDSVIPAKLLEYVKANYPNNYITEWKMQRNKQEIELDNKLELEFNKNGDFLRID